MSTLSDYLKANQILQQDFAKRIGATQGTVSRLAKQSMVPSLALAVAIERETNGAVPASSWVCDEESGTVQQQRGTEAPDAPHAQVA